MIIAGEYSFNSGKEYVEQKFPSELKEIKDAIRGIDVTKHKTKESKEKTMKGKMLYSPISLNLAFKGALYPSGWINKKESCNYPTEYYTNDYIPVERKKTVRKKSAEFRDMDFVKNGLGIEVQFGKYSFMVYNVCAKMTIFNQLGHIQAGVEIVPIKQFAEEMSTGVSYFEQFVWDLHKRGVSNIDIPVYIIGIDADPIPATHQRPESDVNDLFAEQSEDEQLEIEQEIIQNAITGEQTDLDLLTLQEK
jgi:hypothetical protein